MQASASAERRGLQPANGRGNPLERRRDAKPLQMVEVGSLVNGARRSLRTAVRSPRSPLRLGGLLSHT